MPEAAAVPIEKERKYLPTMFGKIIMPALTYLWMRAGNEITDITQHYFPSANTGTRIFLEDIAQNPHMRAGLYFMIVDGFDNALRIRIPDEAVEKFGRHNLALLRSEQTIHSEQHALLASKNEVIIGKDIQGRIRASHNMRTGDAEYEITFKRNTGKPDERIEFNFPISALDAEELRRGNWLEHAQSVTKRRYELLPGLTVDEYKNKNAGLIVIETEANQGVMPPKPWFAGQDVTDRKTYSAHNLAYNPRPTRWGRMMHRLGLA